MSARAAVAGCLSLALLATAAAASPTGTRRATPRTIAIVQHEHISALAQSENRLAWLRGDWGCPKAEIFDLRTRRRVKISAVRGGCGGGTTLYSAFAFDGERVLWQASQGSNSGDHLLVYSAALGDRRTRVLGGGDIATESAFYPPFPMAGAPGRLVFYQYDDCVEDPCLPTGTRVVVGRRTRKLFAQGGSAGLALAGSRLATLDNACNCNLHSPAWSPDGQRLAWIHPGRGLEVAKADGSERRLIAPNAGDSPPRWAPDGSQLAVVVGSSVWLAVADGTGLRPLAAGFDPDWSPDGSEIAYVRANDVYRTGVDFGSHETRLTTDGVQGTSRPRWSADGKTLLVERDNRAYLVDARAGGASILAPADAESPVWSPDGTRIAFTQNDSLAVMNADGSGVHLLTDNLGVDNRDDHAAWSPDGGKIAFQATDTETYYGLVKVIGADGTGQHTIGVGAEPSWAPGGARLAWGNGAASGRGIVAAGVDGSGRRLVGANVHFSPVTIRRARNGALLKKFDVPGTAVEVALSARYVAVVESKGSSKYELRRYRLDGRLLGHTVLSRGVSFVAAGPRVFVYSGPNGIVAVDAETGKARLLVRTPDAAWLSILGRRVVWAERLGDRTRIRALTLAG